MDSYDTATSKTICGDKKVLARFTGNVPAGGGLGSLAVSMVQWPWAVYHFVEPSSRLHQQNHKWTYFHQFQNRVTWDYG
jgi:hypothetical protein